MSNENLMIEVVGSSKKAVDALDKVINKISELQNKFLSAVPAINKFNNSLKSISSNSPLKNIVEGTAKASSEVQKVQSKIMAASAKWEAESRKSLEDAVNRSMQRMQGNGSMMQNQLPKTAKLEPTTFSNRNIAAEIDAITRATSPTIDMSKVKAQTAEIDAFIARLTPAINKMSEAAQSKFSKMAEKLQDVNSNLAKQKQIYSQLKTSYSTIQGGFGKSGTENFGLETKLETTKTSIKKLTAESDRLKASMQKLATPAKNTASALDKVQKSANRAGKRFGTLGRVMQNLKTYAIAGAIYKVTDALSNGIQRCMDYTENMNLFNVAMGENSKRAGEFVDKMSAAFGLDSSNLVKTMGSFYQISTSMGVTSQNAYVLSENFTKLAADLSSFYNISMSAATTKLQAGLVGETEPLRRLGIIITENALKQTAANLGIEKSVQSMSEAEKMHLRYITAMEQTKKVQGDFARTIISPAQGMKILKEQIAQLSRTIGSVFMTILGAVLPYIIAFTKALGALIGRLAKFVGYKPPSYQDLGSGFSISAKNADKFGKSVGGATEKIKELKKQVMGFDEMNILSKQIDTKAGKNGGAAGAGGDFAVPDLTGYDNLMDSVGSRVDELQQKFMSGFEKIGKALEPTRQALSRLGSELDRLKGFAFAGLGDFYQSFLVPVGQWTLNEGLPRFVDILTNGLAQIDWGKINSSLHELWVALTPFAINVGERRLWFFEKVLVPIGTWVMNDAVPAFLNLLSGALKFLNPLLEACKPLFEWLWNDILEPIASWTGGVICDVLNGIGDALGKIGDWMSNNQGVVTAMIGTIGAFFAAWEITKLMGFIQMSGGVTASLLNLWAAIRKVTIAKIVDKAETMAIIALYAKDFVVSLAKGTAEMVKQLVQWGLLAAAKVWDVVKTVAQTVATGALTAAQWLLNIAMDANPIGIIILAIGALIAGLVLLWTKCEWFRNFVTGLVDWIKDFFLNLWNSISKWASDCWNSIVAVWNGVAAWFNSTIIEPVANFFSGLWNGITQFASKTWENIVKVWSVVSGWFKDKVIFPIKNFFQGLWDGIKNIFKSVGSWFSKVFTQAKEAVKSAFHGVVDFFSGIWEKIKNIFTTIGTVIGDAISGAFKGVVNAVINFAEGMINKFIRAINGAIDLINHIPGVSINRLQEINIPRLAKGGLVTESVIANIGEGQHDEAVLPLNDAIFERIADGINKNARTSSVIDEETLYRAFLRALSDSPKKSATFVATLNSKVIAKEVIKEQNNQSMRFSPVYT